jgi:DnaJ-class molecular chaperone
MKEYFSRLYLEDDATQDQVKLAYRKLVKRFHPDHCGNNDYVTEFNQIQDAYEKLTAYFKKQAENIGNNSNKSSANSSEYAHTSDKENNPGTNFSNYPIGSIDELITGTLFSCGTCDGNFWAESYKSDYFICPYCKSLNIVSNISEGFKYHSQESFDNKERLFGAIILIIIILIILFSIK